MGVRTGTAYATCNNSLNLGLLIFFKRIMFYLNKKFIVLKIIQKCKMYNNPYE